MPVVAVAGIAMGATAIATGALTVLQTIAAIGGIIGGIGSLTGNKTLAKIGAVAGLAGGIGAFAESQGWLASASAAETASSAAEASAIEAMKATPSGAEYNVAVDPATSNFGGAAGSNAVELGQVDVAGGAQQATQGLEGVNSGNSISNTISQSSAELSSAMGTAPPPEAGGGLIDAAAPTSPASDLVASPSGEVAAGVNPTDMRLEAGTQSSPMASPADQLTASAKAGGSKVLDLFKDFFTGKDGKMDKNMLSLAGNFLGGMFDSEKAAREELYKTRAETERQQQANASDVPAMNFRSVPKPGGTFKPTSPTYQPVRIASGGLMNAR
jgi:hypothetical protein